MIRSPPSRLPTSPAICHAAHKQPFFNSLGRYWEAIVGNGGAESACSWCRDRYGVSWQIVPRALMAALADPDRAAAARAMTAMMTMRKIDIAAINAARQGTT